MAKRIKESAYGRRVQCIRNAQHDYIALKQEARETGKSFAELVSKEDREVMDEMEKRNSELLRLKLTPGQVHYDTVMQNLSVKYIDNSFIADQVMPTIYTDGAMSGKFWKYDRANNTSYPSSALGQDDRAKVNEISQTRSLVSYALEIQSLKDIVTTYTLQNQTAPLNEMVDSQQTVAHGLAFNKEIRTAAVLMTAGNYAASNKITLTGGTIFDQAGSDPLGVCQDAVAALWRGAGEMELVMIAGYKAHKALRKHAQVLAGIQGMGNLALPASVATKQALAEIFEVDRYIVPMARKNTGTKASETNVRIWTETMVWIGYVAKQPSQKTASFGFSFQDAAPKADVTWLPQEGAAGQYQVRVTFADQQNIVSADSGYLITAAAS